MWLCNLNARFTPIFLKITQIPHLLMFCRIKREIKQGKGRKQRIRTCCSKHWFAEAKCDALKSKGPLIIHQPVESMWISCNSTPHHYVPFTGIHNLTKIEQSVPYMRSSNQNPTCTIIQSHDPSGAQYNTMTAPCPFMSKN